MESEIERRAASWRARAARALRVRGGRGGWSRGHQRPAPDRRRFERPCRYVARPPLALGRLEEMTGGRLADRLRTLRRDGTTHVVMERRELIER
ncbi:MAG: transposase [Myxococcota bacterium]